MCMIAIFVVASLYGCATPKKGTSIEKDIPVVEKKQTASEQTPPAQDKKSLPIYDAVDKEVENFLQK